MSERPPLRLEVRVSTLAPEGNTYEISALADQRAALAAFLDLVEVSRFEAEVTLKPLGKGAVEIYGTVAADYVQNCVVTLEPIQQTADEPIELRLVPEGSVEAASRPNVDIDPDQPDPPDTYPDDHVDIGAIAVEHFALAIDPYPRAPGADFPEQGVGDDPAKIAGPFAALARLKDAPEGEE